MEQVVAVQMQQVVTLLPQAAGTVGQEQRLHYQGRLLPILVAVVGGADRQARQDLVVLEVVALALIQVRLPQPTGRTVLVGVVVVVDSPPQVGLHLMLDQATAALA
jgi:hypothetical protein